MYCIDTVGDCMGSAVPANSRFSAYPDEPIAAGDLVNLVLRPGGGTLDHYFGDEPRPVVLGKIYLGTHHTADGRELIAVGMIYPTIVNLLGVEEIEAMHKVHCDQRNLDEMEARNMLAVFAGKGVREPINPAWRPITRGLH